MRFTRKQIHDLVIEYLCKSLGDNTPTVPIGDDTDPINELGLESIHGVNFACILSDKLPFKIPVDVNPLVNDKKNQARTVGEIVEFLHKLVLAHEEEKNG